MAKPGAATLVCSDGVTFNCNTDFCCTCKDQPTMDPTMAPTDEDPDLVKCVEGSAVEITFAHMDNEDWDMTANNLGGVGPNSMQDPWMFYDNVGREAAFHNGLQQSERPIALKVSNMSRYDADPGNVGDNGFKSHFGAITVKSGMSVQFKFEFYWQDTMQKMDAVDRMIMEFYDIDMMEKLCVYDQTYDDSLEGQMDEDFFPQIGDDSYLSIHTDSTVDSFQYVCFQGPWLEVPSPNDPWHTTKEQNRVAVALTFRDVSSFMVSYEVPAAIDDRVMQFTGFTENLITPCKFCSEVNCDGYGTMKDPQIKCLTLMPGTGNMCTQEFCCDPTPAPTMATMEPTQPPTSCRDIPQVTLDFAAERFDDDNNLISAWLTQGKPELDNLGQTMSAQHEGKIKYLNVGTYRPNPNNRDETEPISLIITNNTYYDCGQMYDTDGDGVDERTQGGTELHNCEDSGEKLGLGSIATNWGYDTEYRFEFRRNATISSDGLSVGSPPIRDLVMTFWDIDHNEQITLIDYEEILEIGIHLTCTELSMVPPKMILCKGPDPPSIMDPDPLHDPFFPRPEQLDVAITVLYRNKNDFAVRYMAREGDNDRVLQFGGYSSPNIYWCEYCSKINCQSARAIARGYIGSVPDAAQKVCNDHETFGDMCNLETCCVMSEEPTPEPTCDPTEHDASCDIIDCGVFGMLDKFANPSGVLCYATSDSGKTPGRDRCTKDFCCIPCTDKPTATPTPMPVVTEPPTSCTPASDVTFDLSQHLGFENLPEPGVPNDMNNLGGTGYKAVANAPRELRYENVGWFYHADATGHVNAERVNLIVRNLTTYDCGQDYDETDSMNNCRDTGLENGYGAIATNKALLTYYLFSIVDLNNQPFAVLPGTMSFSFYDIDMSEELHLFNVDSYELSSNSELSVDTLMGNNNKKFQGPDREVLDVEWRSCCTGEQADVAVKATWHSRSEFMVAYRSKQYDDRVFQFQGISPLEFNPCKYCDRLNVVNGATSVTCPVGMIRKDGLMCYDGAVNNCTPDFCCEAPPIVPPSGAGCPPRSGQSGVTGVLFDFNEAVANNNLNYQNVNQMYTRAGQNTPELLTINNLGCTRAPADAQTSCQLLYPEVGITWYLDQTSVWTFKPFDLLVTNLTRYDCGQNQIDAQCDDTGIKGTGFGGINMYMDTKTRFKFMLIDGATGAPLDNALIPNGVDFQYFDIDQEEKLWIAGASSVEYRPSMSVLTMQQNVMDGLGNMADYFFTGPDENGYPRPNAGHYPERTSSNQVKRGSVPDPVYNSVNGDCRDTTDVRGGVKGLFDYNVFLNDFTAGMTQANAEATFELCNPQDAIRVRVDVNYPTSEWEVTYQGRATDNNRVVQFGGHGSSQSQSCGYCDEWATNHDCFEFIENSMLAPNAAEIVCFDITEPNAQNYCVMEEEGAEICCVPETPAPTTADPTCPPTSAPATYVWFQSGCPGGSSMCQSIADVGTCKYGLSESPLMQAMYASTYDFPIRPWRFNNMIDNNEGSEFRAAGCSYWAPTQRFRYNPTLTDRSYARTKRNANIIELCACDVDVFDYVPKYVLAHQGVNVCEDCFPVLTLEECKVAGMLMGYGDTLYREINDLTKPAGCITWWSGENLIYNAAISSTSETRGRQVCYCPNNN